MRLSLRRLNRALLARQLLLDRAPLGVEDAVDRLVALQAQEPASPYLALWGRLDSFDPTALDRAFAGYRVVKGTSVRMTLHAVGAADHAPFHEAMQPSLRPARLLDRRFRVAGLSPEQADALIPEVLEFTAEPRTNAAMEAWMDARLGVLPRPGVWWALKTYGPFIHAPTGGPWSFGPRPSYLAARDLARVGDPDLALKHLVRRYLEGFGPATVADVAQFAQVHRPRVRKALASIASQVVEVAGPDGQVMYDVPGGPLPAEDTPAPARLLPMWDSTLLAHADRGRILPEPLRRHIIRRNGDTLPVLLVDGLVTGVWRAVPEGIEATALVPLSGEAWTALDAEAASLRQLLLKREPLVYSRYTRWWSTLPAAEVRILGA